MLFRLKILIPLLIICFHLTQLFAYSQSKIGYPRLMQGPMIGLTSHDTIYIWMRASGNFDCMIEYDTDSAFPNPKRTAAVKAAKETDYCVVAKMENLTPSTRYYYRVYVNGNKDPYVKEDIPLSCKTAPAPEAKTAFKVAFGSCARIQEDNVQPIWKVVSAANPDLFFWLGDNIYGDATDPDILAEEYRRQRSVGKLVPILRRTPQLAIWDDHDYALNDHDRTNPVKEEALNVFKQYWPNMSYGQPDAPGVFFKHSYGGIDFFFIDCRYHRDPNNYEDSSEKTMLGQAQLQWLKQGLKKSTSPFKIILSGSGWTVAKGAGGDSWASYLHERNNLFNFIRDEKISGVVLVSGDTHVGELNCIPWSEQGGYDLYDLVSSPLGQSPGTGWVDRRPEIRIRPVMASGPNFGMIQFDLRKEPTLTFTLYDRYFHTAWEPLVLKASDLTNGVTSWKKTIDPQEHKRLIQYRNGEGYYKPLQ